MISSSNTLLRNSYIPGQTAHQTIHGRIYSFLDISQDQVEKIARIFLRNINTSGLSELDEILDRCDLFKTDHHIVCKITGGVESPLYLYPISSLFPSLKET